MYALSSLAATVANLIFGAFVLLKNPSSRINQLWAFTIATLCLWGFGEFILRVTPDHSTAEIVCRIGGIGFCLLPAPFLHFTAEFTGRITAFRKRIIPVYAVTLLICLLQVLGYITSAVQLPWGYTFTPTILYTPFIVWLEFCFAIGIFWCWKKYRSATSERERKQTLLIILGATIPLTIGSLTDAFLPLFGMEVYRLAVVTTTATVALVSIGVVKYQLMSLTPETTASIILEAMGDLVIVTDTTGSVRFANLAFREALGYDTGVVKIDDFIEDMAAVEPALTARNFIQCETAYKRKDGTTFPVSLSITHIIDRQEHVGVIFVAVDISSRIAIENKLRESEGMFRALSEASPASIFVYRDEKFLYVNKGTEIINGYSREELLAMKFTDLIHPDIRDTVRERADARQRGEDVPSRYEVKIVRKDGEIRWLDFAGARVEMNGQAAGVGIAFDITERKISDEQLKEQAALLNKANDAIIVFDIDEKVRFWNPSAERLYGWKASDAIGRKIRTMVHSKDENTFDTAMASVVAGNEWNEEMIQMNSEGKEIIADSRWTLIKDSEGKPKSILVINSNITEHKSLESQFLRMQRLESLGTLASGIAHDLNNILAPIMVGIGSIRRVLKDEKKGVADMIENSAKRGAALVQQVLTFAKGSTTERSVVLLKYLLAEIKKIVQETFPKSITLRMSIPNDIHSITTDAVQFHQVFINLCVNARDAMPTGGVLSISAENIVVDKETVTKHINAHTGSYVRIKVSDTGTGIRPEVLDRIFDPFFTTKEVGQGTGLGLSTVISIVKNHGGFLHVESTVGVGTTFWVYFPAVPPVPDAEVSQPGENIPMANKELILVVDDESSIIEIARETLEANNYTVVTASNGKEAVDIFTERHHEIKAVMIDLGMPLMDGNSAIRIMKSIRKNVKIIAASGNSPELKDADSIASYTNAFLQKPYSTSNLLNTLHSVLKS